MRRIIMNAVTVASLVLILSCLSAAAQQPDATLTLHTASIASRAGVGYSWGGGIITFQGKEYPCRVDGLSVGEVGISSADAVGNVYHLTNLEDISGTYMAVSTGAILAGGGDVATMRNQRGVVIELTDTSQGAKIMLAVQGVKITLEEGAPTASTRN